MIHYLNKTNEYKIRKYQSKSKSERKETTKLLLNIKKKKKKKKKADREWGDAGR